MSRWTAQLQGPASVAALSVSEVNVLWTSDLGGLVIDPTANNDVVQMAFPASSGNTLAPAEPVTWLAATWLTGIIERGYMAQCLVGPSPGLVQLTAGQAYDVWAKITLVSADYPAGITPEVPVSYAGTITVY